MRATSARWECKDCGHRHERMVQRCVKCDFIELEPVEPPVRQLRRSLFALLPVLVSLAVAVMLGVFFVL